MAALGAGVHRVREPTEKLIVIFYIYPNGNAYNELLEVQVRAFERVLNFQFVLYNGKKQKEISL